MDPAGEHLGDDSRWWSAEAGPVRRAAWHRDLLHYSAMQIGFSLDVVETAQAVADVVVHGFAELGAVALARPVLVGDEPALFVGGGESSLVRVAAASATGTWPGPQTGIGLTYPVFPDNPELRSIQQGRPIALDHEEILRVLGDGPEARALVPTGVHSLLVTPLFARGLILGTVTAWRIGRRRMFDEDDAELLSEISSRAALGIDNARRYTRERRAAVALQRRLLPHATTNTSAARTAGVYRPAGGGAGVGGDWFDVIRLPSLRIALVVGDVIGHGLPAAATMGRLRTALQTFAGLEMEPAEVLARAEDLVQQLAAEAPADERDAMGATCLYALYDPTTCQCTFANAGQPPPVLLPRTGAGRVLDVPPGPPLGVGGVPPQSTTVDVEPGSVIALFTDGLLEPTSHDGTDDMERLREVFTSEDRSDRDLDEIGRAVVARALGRTPRDDVALLLARTRAVPQDQIACWEFPPSLESVAEARAVAGSQLADWGLAEFAFTTELVVSELVTNAIRYAGGPVTMRLIRDECLICEVSDPSNTQPRLMRAATTDEGGRGLFIVAQCTTRWGCRYAQQGKTIWTEQPFSDARPHDPST